MCFKCPLFLLGATVAGYVFALSAMRFVVSIWTTNQLLKYLFVASVIGLGYITFNGVYDLILIMAGLFGTYGAFCAHDKDTRRFFLGGGTLNLVYNAIIVSPVAFATSFFFLSSNVESYWRFYIRKREK